MRDRLKRRAGEAGFVDGEVADDSPRATKKHRPSAVGTLRSARANTSCALTTLAEGAGQIEVWTPPEVTAVRHGCAVLPSRAGAYTPAKRAQQTQLAKVKGWKLRRMLRGRPAEADVYFTIGAMEKAVAKWDGSGLVPLAVVKAATMEEELAVMTTHSQGTFGVSGGRRRWTRGSVRRIWASRRQWVDSWRRWWSQGW